jgi:hypothetical protein
MAIVFFCACSFARAGVLADVRGVVHDPSHRPVQGASVLLHAAASDYVRSAITAADGSFSFDAVPAGDYVVSVSYTGFESPDQAIRVNPGSAHVVHFQLELATQSESVEVHESPDLVDPNSATPTTTISRSQIEQTPGASLTNSMNMITDYVPGAYMVHDQLHVRGGHQVSWALDGVPIPNTNIASNVGPQIDPKDIDYLEVERGGYGAEYGDRTYGVFNVVPRTGFERNGEFELNSTYGSFNQSNDEISYGDHTERSAWYTALNGNTSNYGLSTPGPQILHDAANGVGAFVSLLFNLDPGNQFRMVASLRGDDYQIPNDPQQQASGMSDQELERDAAIDFTWVHTLSPGVTFSLSPFYHYNRSNYDGGAQDVPVSATQQSGSTYAGAQSSVNAVSARHNAEIGVYGFAQREDEFISLTANDGSGAALRQRDLATGHLEAVFLSDQFKATQWLTLTAGVRLTHFTGAVNENAADPRVGAAIRIPRVNWILHGFYGRYYQAPPLVTVGGPLLGYAVTQGVGFLPLDGERDEEHQAGVTIPMRGWLFDVNNFRINARNYFDHNAIGNSNVFFPLTIAGARLYGWEFTLRSPRLLHCGEVDIAYSYQHALGEGAVTGGLTDFSPPAGGFFFLDHDQRHTLHANFLWDLPGKAVLSGDVYFGSGFTNGDSPVPAHLQPHTTTDLSLSRPFGEKLTLGLTALNVTNRRFLLDNSLTFGGLHYADPRQVYMQLSWRFLP